MPSPSPSSWMQIELEATLKGSKTLDCWDLQAKIHDRPLHGIPILLKDVIATADKMANTGEIRAQ